MFYALECPQCSGTIEKIKVGGRNGYYCQNCQKK
ncbi:zinc finger domain-containing protein [Halalkalibaculum roseum]